MTCVNKWLRTCSSLVISLCASVSLAIVPVVDFETTPSGGVPMDDTPLGITDAYVLTDGVRMTFGFDETDDQVVDAPAYFEQIGRNGDDGFSGFPSGQNDTAASGFTSLLGNFFIRPPGHFHEVVPPTALRIDLTVPSGIRATTATGEIWDIDTGGSNFEEFTVSAFDNAGLLLDQVVSPRGINPAVDPANSLNRLPWRFELTSGRGMRYMIIDFTGNKPSGTGIAFNNFSVGTEPIPEPAALVLAACAIAAPLTWRRCRAT